MTQLFSVTVDGVSITDRVFGSSSTYDSSRVINFATVSLFGDPSLLIEKDIQIISGDNTFNGFIYSYTKNRHNTYTLSCRSLGGKLSEPFFIDKEGIALATNSSDLCSEYSALTGVPISYQAVEIDFGGSWKQDGTPESELLKLAGVIGADIYDNGDGIIIENVKPVSGTAKIINLDDVVDVAQIGDTIENNGLGVVITKTANDSSDDGGDIIADKQIAMDIIGDKARFYLSPSSSLDSLEGATIIATSKPDELSECNMLNGDVSMSLDGSIQSIVAVTLNGVNTTNYHYEPNTNKIFFDTPQYGRCCIKYRTLFDEALIDVENTVDGKFYHIVATKDSQLIDEVGFLEDSDDSDGSISGEKYYIPDGTDYVNGFRMYIEQGLGYELYDGIDKIPYSDKITSSLGTYTRFDDVYLEKQEDGTYRGYIDVSEGSVKDVTSGGVSIPYTTGVDPEQGTYIELDRWYPNVQVEYTFDGERLDIQYPYDEEEQTLLLDGEIEIPLDGKEPKWDNPKDFPCGYPADFPFNIASLLNIGIEDCVGKHINGMTANIDSKGYCYAHITTDGIYEYETSHIKPKTSITLRANSNGSLTDGQE